MTIKNDCFCELAPLYVLDQLSDEERRWIEQQIAECPDLADELAGYQLGMTAMAYTVPAPPIQATLKHRLFDRLELGPPPSAPDPAPAVVAHQAIRSQELNWQPHPTPGVEVAIVHTDETKRELVGVLRADPGVHYPWHRHAAIEEIFMLDGDLVIGDEVYGAGDYIRSQPGSAHAPYTVGGCRFFFHTSIDDEYPDLAGVSS